jgi:hypothetical protein
VEPSIVFENRHVIWAAFNDFRAMETIKIGGKNKSVDFADALIVRKSCAVAARFGQSLAGFYTFDRAALVLKYTRLYCLK